jgi:hypothetical protein
MKNPKMGDIVIYNHPGSLDGTYPPMQSPAIVQKVYKLIDDNVDVIDMVVFSNSNGFFFRKASKEGIEGTNWQWPTE